MTPDQLIGHFGGTQTSAAKALGINQSTVHDWVRQGWVPLAAQVVAERMSAGAVKADMDDGVREFNRRRGRDTGEDDPLLTPSVMPVAVDESEDATPAPITSAWDAVRRTLPEAN